MHPTKTRIVNVFQPERDSIFLGYHFERTRRGRVARWPREKSLTKYRDRHPGADSPCQRTRDAHIIQRCNRVTRGWYEYFRHSKPNTFATMDGWVRQRLRAILRKRRGDAAEAGASDHQRWAEYALLCRAGSLLHAGGP